MIRIGPAGSGGLGNKKGLEMLKSLGLNAMEVEFTYGVRMSNDEAKRIGEIARGFDISLSVHAPYYINLASKAKDKKRSSITRVLEACEKAHWLGAGYVVFHAGFYQDRTSREIYDIIKKETKGLLSELRRKGWAVLLAPETTGKISQFGDLDELLRMRRETGAELCVDFAHLLARGGTIDYGRVLDKLKAIKHIHSHFSGIQYTKKGERRHLKTDRKAIAPLIKEILRRDIDITIINESPDPVADSIMTGKIIESLNG